MRMKQLAIKLNRTRERERIGKKMRAREEKKRTENRKIRIPVVR